MSVRYELAPTPLPPMWKIPEFHLWNSYPADEQDIVANITLAIGPANMAKARQWVQVTFPDADQGAYALWHNLKHYELNLHTSREVLNEINSMF